MRINDIYNNQGVKFRILSEFATGYIWINIESDSALPEYIDHFLLVELIEQGKCFLDTDPFKDLALIIENPTSKILFLKIIKRLNKQSIGSYATTGNEVKFRMLYCVPIIAQVMKER